MNDLEIIGRDRLIFNDDYVLKLDEIKAKIQGSSILVIGAAGSIGSSVTRLLYDLQPARLFAVDLSENNLVELVRTIRSSRNDSSVEFKTFVIDVGTTLFDRFMTDMQPFDYVLNLSAMKHVRSEKDIYSMLRMIEVNVFNSIKVQKYCLKMQTKKYFCVSTDKAANPANIMGATKLLMESALNAHENCRNLSYSRFANVAFSDGSLLFGMDKRLHAKQPISAPIDIQRYFITSKEAAILCVLSLVYGEFGDIFVPSAKLNLPATPFSKVVTNFLETHGYRPKIYDDEDNARRHNFQKYPSLWPCFFFSSSTSGEKKLEEFHTESDVLDTQSFKEVDIIKQTSESIPEPLKLISELRLAIEGKSMSYDSVIKLLTERIPSLDHIRKKENLDEKM